MSGIDKDPWCCAGDKLRINIDGRIRRRVHQRHAVSPHPRPGAPQGGRPCGSGRVDYRVPPLSRTRSPERLSDVTPQAPLTIDAREWVHQVYASGGTRQIGEKLHTITVVPVADETGDVTENSEIRMFHRIDYRGQSWTWELITAHWADPATRNNNARIPIYIGRWPD